MFNILDTEAKHLDYASIITRFLASIIDVVCSYLAFCLCAELEKEYP